MKISELPPLLLAAAGASHTLAKWRVDAERELDSYLAHAAALGLDKAEAKAFLELEVESARASGTFLLVDAIIGAKRKLAKDAL